LQRTGISVTLVENLSHDVVVFRPLKLGVMLLPVMNVSVIFEVMDKEPSLVQIWVLSLVLGVGGFFLAKYKYWLLPVVLAIALALVWSQLSELRDPLVAPVIIREAGYSYVVQSYVALAIALMLPLIGAVVKWKRSSL
jgi:TctA family transporter